MSDDVTPDMNMALFTEAYARTELRLKPFADQGEYVVTVMVPPPAAEPEGGFPVVFVTDADLALGTAAEFARMAAITREVPAAVLVGIGYGQVSFGEIFARRFWDMTPPRRNPTTGADSMYADLPTGGADAFLDFLCGAVTAEAAKLAPINRERSVLVGYSLAGLFATYVLTKRPDAFHSIVIGSPSLWFDGGRHLDEALKVGADGLPKRVFISVGELEQLDPTPTYQVVDMVGKYARLANHLTQFRSERFHLEAQLFPRETHITGYPLAVTRGIASALGAWR